MIFDEIDYYNKYLSIDVSSGNLESLMLVLLIMFIGMIIQVFIVHRDKKKIFIMPALCIIVYIISVNEFDLFFWGAVMLPWFAGTYTLEGVIIFLMKGKGERINE